MSDKQSAFRFPTSDAAEAAFYTAFADCDYTAMDAVWASEGGICIHPGSPVLFGRDVVMRSWANILVHSEPPTIRIKLVSRTVSEELAVHVVEEHIAPADSDSAAAAVVQATNVYRREADGWRLLEHHASIARALPSKTNSEANTEAQGQPTLQ